MNPNSQLNQLRFLGESQNSELFYGAWEDRLAFPRYERNSIASLSECDDSLDYLPVGEPDAFSLGGIEFRPAGACRRCVVPSRDTRTGTQFRLFRDVFEARRYQRLRQDVDTRDWQDYYRLGLNTSVVICRYRLTIGDQLKLQDSLGVSGTKSQDLYAKDSFGPEPTDVKFEGSDMFVSDQSKPMPRALPVDLLRDGPN